MRISSLRIKNYRSFGEDGVLLNFNHKLNSFIGLNSSGKTASLEALKKIFGTYAEKEIFRWCGFDKTDYEMSLKIRVVL
ncbi:MAG: ATP-dependent endonuclease [Segetibacter sp.]|nr:ATP-dependent endonuclease [Segetibacter sp.]